MRPLLPLAFLLACAAPTPAPRTAPPPAPAAPAPPPPGFRETTAEGISLLVPSAWTPIHPAGVLFGFASFEGSDKGMSVNAIRTPRGQGDLEQFAAGVAAGAATRGATLKTQTRFVVDGHRVVENELVTRPVTESIRGVVRISAGREHVVFVTCHTHEAEWDSLKSACDPIFASMRVGPLPAGDRPPPGARFLHGSDWRVAVPASWADTAPDSPDTRALVRSSSDRSSMVVVTVSEVAPESPPAPATRDALLARIADFVAHKPGYQVLARKNQPNEVDLDFTRALAAHVTKLYEAAYEAADAFWLVTCGGPDEALETHRGACDAILRSVRFERPK